jgi:hypothetical protein
VPLEVVGNAYKFKTATDDEVFIGDPADAVFHPLAKLNRWGGECFFKFRFDDSQIAEKNVSLHDDKVEWDTPAFAFRYYQTTEGLEFEVILKAKPAKNTFVFSIESLGLSYFYQPPLTQDFDPADCVELSETHARLRNGGEVNRPENVVGSYAVYHATRTSIHRSQADGDKYRTGKAFHIYRPKLTDSMGKTAWANLSIDEQQGTMTMTLPQAFLDSAVYPVTVVPTFG